MDTTRNIIYRSFVLNDESILDSVTGGGAYLSGIAGCVVDSADISDVDVVQFMEKRSQSDGMDAGTVELGARRIRLAGTLYNVSRPLLYDDLWDLRAALNPILAQRDEPADKGYRPLYFATPTARTDANDYPAGYIPLQVKAMPRAFQASFNRDLHGGDDCGGEVPAPVEVLEVLDTNGHSYIRARVRCADGTVRVARASIQHYPGNRECPPDTDVNYEYEPIEAEP